MSKIEQVFQKTLESFPEVKAKLEYEDKLIGIYIIKEKEDYKLCIGILGKKFLETTSKEELTGIIAHELSHGLAETEGVAKQTYLTDQDQLEDDLIADKKASERGYKKQLLAALNLTKKEYADYDGNIESRIKILNEV